MIVQTSPLRRSFRCWREAWPLPWYHWNHRVH